MSEQRDRDDCEHGPSARECDCNAIELQEFSPDAMLAEFLRANPAQREPYRFKASAFLAFLLSRGLLLEIQYGDLYMGDGHSADVRFTPLERPSGGEQNVSTTGDQ